MDLIDREKFIKNYCKKQCDGDGIDCIYLNECKAIKSVREAQKVEAIPLSVIEDIKAEIQKTIEKGMMDAQYGLETALLIIDEKVKEHET